MNKCTKVATIIRKENVFLLVQERASKVRGLWNWPQGNVKEGEDLKRAAIREVKEETGLDIRIVKEVTVLTDTFPDIKELHVYLASIIKGVIKFPQDEIIDVKFFSLEQIEKMKSTLVGGWVYTTISQID